MVSDPDLLEAVRDCISPEGCPVATADDVAKRVDVQRETVRQRLLRLAADDHLRTRKLGRARVFWIPDALAPAVESAAPPAPDQQHAPEFEIADALGLVAPPGRDPEAVEARADALRAVLEELVDAHPEGRSKAELLEAADEAVGAAHYDDLQSLWRNWLYEALSKLVGEGMVESPGASRKGWRIQQ